MYQRSLPNAIQIQKLTLSLSESQQTGRELQERVGQLQKALQTSDNERRVVQERFESSKYISRVTVLFLKFYLFLVELKSALVLAWPLYCTLTFNRPKFRAQVNEAKMHQGQVAERLAQLQRDLQESENRRAELEVEVKQVTSVFIFLYLQLKKENGFFHSPKECQKRRICPLHS